MEYLEIITKGNSS